MKVKKIQYVTVNNFGYDPELHDCVDYDNHVIPRVGESVVGLPEKTLNDSLPVFIVKRIMYLKATEQVVVYLTFDTYVSNPEKMA